MEIDSKKKPKIE